MLIHPRVTMPVHAEWHDGQASTDRFESGCHWR